jgi:hypothetical protein
MIYRHGGDNRSGKTFTMALYAWEAFNLGRTVYCNCPPHIPGRPDEHVLNFPHIDAQPKDLFELDLYNCCAIIDQAEQFMDAFDAPRYSARDLSYFGYQATKRGIDLHFDTVRHMNILNRIRDNAHFFITTKRIPPNPMIPLLAIMVSVRSRNNPVRVVRFVVREPWRYFPIYNHDVMIPPPKLVEKLLAKAGPKYITLPPGVRGEGQERIERKETVVLQNPRWKD